jgi:ATP-dependent helicase/nuclease subunit A
LLPARQTLEAFAERERAEVKRLLYVAVTRAEEKCFFTWIGQPEEHSWASMLQFPLTPGVHKQERYALEVWQGPWQVPVIASERSVAIHVRRKWQTDTAEKIASRISVSSLLDSMTPRDIGASPKAAAAQVKPVFKSSAKLEQSMRVPYMGTKIHALLERLRYHPNTNFENQINDWFGTQGAPLRQGLKYVAELQTPPMHELLKTGEVEWGFQTKTKRGVLEGQVDLWGIANGEIWVIDYKSGSEFFKERAFSQLELYAYAIGRGGYDLPVKLAVIYPLAQKVEVRQGRPSNVIAKEYNL